MTSRFIVPVFWGCSTLPRVCVLSYPHFDHTAGRAGCSPGAVRLYRKGLLNDDDSYRASNEIPGIRGRIGATPEQTSEIVYCSRLGYRVMLMWIVMTHLLGYENVRI
jgi:hypothetical protein